MTALPSLAPCPFCGGKAKLISNVMGPWRSRSEGYNPNGSRVTCSAADCPTMGKVCYGSNRDQDAIAAWNRRAAPVGDISRMSFDEVVAKLGHIIPCYRKGSPGCRLDDDANEELCADGCCMLTIYRAGLSAAPSLPSQEDVARVIDPEAWRDDLPTPTRADTEAFHARRQASCATAARILALMGQSGDGWLPIESAPKDGTMVLIWSVTDGAASIAYYSASGWTHVAGAEIAYTEDGGKSAFGPPTHWRPLPAPPAKEGR